MGDVFVVSPIWFSVTKDPHPRCLIPSSLPRPTIAVLMRWPISLTPISSGNTAVGPGSDNMALLPVFGEPYQYYGGYLFCYPMPI